MSEENNIETFEYRVTNIENNETNLAKDEALREDDYFEEKYPALIKSVSKENCELSYWYKFYFIIEAKLQLK